jgi:hypothetical protein
LNIKKGIYFLFLFFLSSSIWAQGTYHLGAIPSLNMNKKVDEKWSMNTKVESRVIYKSVNPQGDIIKKYSHELSDLTFIMSRSIGLSSRISAGYMLRLEEGEIQQRFIQQYTLIQTKNGYRLAHRIVTDQTISPSEKPEYRARYRVSAEIPLNGKSLDTKEFYVRANNEYLNSVQNKQYDLEIRLVPLLGYVFSDKIKLEAGLDYRLNSFLAKQTEQDVWLSINFFVEY